MVTLGTKDCGDTQHAQHCTRRAGHDGLHRGTKGLEWGEPYINPTPIRTPTGTTPGQVDAAIRGIEVALAKLRQILGLP